MERARRRIVRSLVLGVALGSTGHIAASTVATIVAEDIAGTSALSGAPGASVVLGAALGATLLSIVMVRRGRRFGISLGYGVGVVGAVVATVAILMASLPVLLLGTVLIGFGNSSNQLSRYVAADLFAESRRASAIGTVVWASTVGAVIGPNLVSVAGGAAGAIGLPTLAGPYLLPIVFVGAAALLSFGLLRPDPYTLAWPSDEAGEAATADVRIRELLRRPSVLAAVVALVVGQIVMVLIMTMTPLHMTHHGHDLAAVGLVISGHTFGMFALSPVSGRLTDRWGSPPVMVAGLGVVGAAAVLSAVAPADGGFVLFLALFLLGFGWNLGYVAGSALLSHGLSLAERTRLQGVTDAVIWSSAAGASLSSGVVVAVASYTALGLLGASMVVVPIWLVLTRHRAIAAGRSAAA
jgi:MFS family permease